MRSVSLLILVGVAIVLSVLAVLQYRWITQVSEAEQNRQRENLAIATTRFAEDFEREMMSLVTPFRRPGPPGPNQESGGGLERLAHRYDQWTATSRNPELLRDLLFAKQSSQGELQMFRFDPVTRTLDPIEWPAGLSALREWRGGRGVEGMNLEHVPAFVTPLMRGGRGFGGARLFDFQPPEFLGLEVVRLNKKFLTDTFLPFLVQRHFSKEGDFDYDILIAQNGNNEIVYRSSPGLFLSDFQTSRDASVRLMIGEGGRGRGGPDRRGPPDGRFGRMGPDPARGWQLYAKHHAGSLQSFTNQFRRRNLLISFGVFAVLAIGIAFTFLSSERVRAMGKMQLEFAAGLSHELRTPLAVIRSAGYNLATGNITARDDVARYGKVLQEQGLRLSDMVEQALLFAQTQSGRNRYERVPVDVKDVIEKAINSCHAVLPKHPCEIVAQVNPDLPMALTDANALGHILHNLLVNALKYGSNSGRIGLAAQAAQTANGSEIELSVDNGGPTIDPADLDHIFEPFFRGKNTEDVSGSGLGLYIVKSIMDSLGGRVSVTSTEADGTRFTLHIPVAA